MLFILACIHSPLAAQRCATVEYNKLVNTYRPTTESEGQFETWLKNKIANKRSRAANSGHKEEATVYTIPVVVHIIHDGEDEGVGLNIPDEQILSQIEVLTEDFRRTNADASKTPVSFLPVAADVELEFALAKRDPEGLPTNGIIRVDGNRKVWNLSDNYELKNLSYWPSADYLNIWVTDLSGTFLGYAQFPTTDQLAGLDDASESQWTDGVVIDTRAFGSLAKFPSGEINTTYDLGRTTTHEVGHFFGLRHIWGDDNGGCSASDYVDDTPNQGGDTGGCPSSSISSCSSSDMYQNYMDYTNDACMNLFTEGQKERMRTILDNSPRRKSLTVSKGAIAPVVVSNDLGIRKILSPAPKACFGSPIPQLQIRNYGTNTITSATISMKAGNAPAEEMTFIVNLAPLAITTVEFSPINLPSSGQLPISFEIIKVNNVADGNSDNDNATVNVKIQDKGTLPLLQSFNGIATTDALDKWTIGNPDGQRTWQIAPNVVNIDGSSNALFVNFFDYETEGEYDTLFSPALDLSGVTLAILSFERSYAMFPQVDAEGLIIKASTNCGQSFDHTIFEAYGEQLATAKSTTSYYAPSGSDQWKKECLSLDQVIGNDNVIFAIIAKGAYGNNLYIDNISITNSSVSGAARDLGIISLSKPSKISCNDLDAPFVIVQNQGCSIENSVTLQYQFDDDQSITQNYIIEDLKPGQSYELSLNNQTFSPGAHSYILEIVDAEDINTTGNNYLEGTFNINNAVDIAPLKEDFENFDQSMWVAINDDQNLNTWLTTSTNKGTSIYLSGLEKEGWLASPSIDFRGTDYAVLYFDMAYSYEENTKDGLKVLLSTNCGVSYDYEIFSAYGEELNTATFTEAPKSDSVWTRVDLDISGFVLDDNVRLAFITAKDNEAGNNIYLDNIEILTTPYTSPKVVDNLQSPAIVYPNPSLDGIVNIVFTLDQRQSAEIIIYNTKGQMIVKQAHEDVLNQTFSYDLQDWPQGLYLVKMVGETFSTVKKIRLTH